MGEAKAIAAAAGGAGEAEAFLVAEIEKLAGEKGRQVGDTMAPEPCRSVGCGHPDCRAARALFRYRRLKSIESIGGGA